jgi:hypothetical protein
MPYMDWQWVMHCQLSIVIISRKKDRNQQQIIWLANWLIYTIKQFVYLKTFITLKFHMQIENYGGKGLHIFSLYIQSTWYSSECDESLKKQYFLPIFIFCLTLQNIEGPYWKMLKNILELYIINHPVRNRFITCSAIQTFVRILLFFIVRVCRLCNFILYATSPSFFCGLRVTNKFKTKWEQNMFLLVSN